MSKKRISKASENQRSWIYQYTPLSLSLITIASLPLSLLSLRSNPSRFNLSTCLSPPRKRDEPSVRPLDEYEMVELLGEIGRNRWGRYFFFFFAFVLLRSRFLSFFFLWRERKGDGGEEDLYTLATFESTLNKWSVIQACIDLKWFHNIFMDLCV